MRGTAWLGRADISLESGGDIFGMEGATALLNLMATHGNDFSGTRVGDAQRVSNVQAGNRVRPIEAWVSLPLWRDTLSAKTGLIDLNSEFDVQDVGTFFINSSHGIGPEFAQSGRNGPSIFPSTSVGLILETRQSGWTGRLGIFDAIAGAKRTPFEPYSAFPARKAP